MRKEICKIYDSLPSFDGAMDLGCNIVMKSNDDGLWLKNIVTGAIRQLQKGCLIYGFNKEDYNWDVIDNLENNGCAYSGEIRYGGISRWDDFEDGFGGFTWTLHPDGRYYADEDGYGAEDDEEIKICVILDSNLNVVAPWQPMDISFVLKLLRREELREILGEVLDSDRYEIRVELTDDGTEIRIVIEDENNSEYIFFVLNNDIWAGLNERCSMEENRDRMNMVNISNGDYSYSWEDIRAMLNEPVPMTYKELLKAFASHKDIRDSLVKYPAKVFWPKDMVCKHCGRRIVSLFYSSPAWTWEQLCGRAGVLYICPYCKEADHFDCEIMN